MMFRKAYEAANVSRLNLPTNFKKFYNKTFVGIMFAKEMAFVP